MRAWVEVWVVRESLVGERPMASSERAESGRDKQGGGSCLLPAEVFRFLGVGRDVKGSDALGTFAEVGLAAPADHGGHALLLSEGERGERVEGER